MLSIASVLVALTAAVSAAPAPAPALEPRAPATCGSNAYTAAQVNQASVAACNYFKAGNTAGSSSYPHRYNNYEGFSFGGVAGPYQEFPILKSGVYTGGRFSLSYVADVFLLIACCVVLFRADRD